MLKYCLVLVISYMAVGCSVEEPVKQEPIEVEADIDVVEPAVVETAAEIAEKPTQLCFRNEYPFEQEPEYKDIESLTIELDGDQASGEYSWLPAFKDQRIGQFEGEVDGQTITASYRFMQEGQSAEASITIALESDRAFVEGGDPELGLSATIARVNCSGSRLQPCSDQWHEDVEKKLQTGDSQGHGPDIGSFEWRSVVEFKLGVRGNPATPSRSSDEWCKYVDNELFGD